MKFVNFYRKPISVLVVVAFTLLISFSAIQSPAEPWAVNGEKSSVASSSADAAETSGHFEKEERGPDIKKNKKIPWLIIGAAVVVSAVLIYFLVIKKPKFTLSVTLGANCNGTPNATAKYSKGTAVDYNYTSLDGFSIPQVKLDGAVIPASGTITMNSDHALEVTTEPMYTLNVNLGTGCGGVPGAGSTYKKDTQVNYNYSLLSNYTNLQVMLDGVSVPAAGTVIMDKSKSLTITAAPDIRGTWNLTYSVLYLGNFSFEIAFSGTPAGGTCSIAGENMDGTYMVVGDQVVFDIIVHYMVANKQLSALRHMQQRRGEFRPYVPWTFSGNLQSGVFMSGSHDFPEHNRFGTWTAIRQGSTVKDVPRI